MAYSYKTKLLAVAIVELHGKVDEACLNEVRMAVGKRLTPSTVLRWKADIEKRVSSEQLVGIALRHYIENLAGSGKVGEERIGRVLDEVEKTMRHLRRVVIGRRIWSERVTQKLLELFYECERQGHSPDFVVDTLIQHFWGPRIWIYERLFTGHRYKIMDATGTREVSWEEFLELWKARYWYQYKANQRMIREENKLQVYALSEDSGEAVWGEIGE